MLKVQGEWIDRCNGLTIVTGDPKNTFFNDFEKKNKKSKQ
tara:strand:+ start:1452 stop:1571 length:120 start_codon:yes stop_codon:yes gene_type:complete